MRQRRCHVGTGSTQYPSKLTYLVFFRGVYYTGGSLNPARSFGPCVIAGKFESYHWIYWIGPILGSLVASGFYVLIKALEYETVNPEQDHSSPSEKHPQDRDAFHNEDESQLKTSHPAVGAGPNTATKHNGAMHNGEHAAYTGGPELEAGRST